MTRRSIQRTLMRNRPAYRAGSRIMPGEGLPSGPGFERALTKAIRDAYENADALVFNPSEFPQP